jgi:phage replication O-like protein O
MPGFTKFDNPILEKVLTSDLTKRQLKILLLVVRFSAGCQKSYTILRKEDYAYAGLSPYCVAEELDELAKRKVIGRNRRRDIVWINPKVNEWKADRRGNESRDNLRRFFKIANKNLPRWRPPES